LFDDIVSPIPCCIIYMCENGQYLNILNILTWLYSLKKNLLKYEGTFGLIYLNCCTKMAHCALANHFRWVLKILFKIHLYRTNKYNMHENVIILWKLTEAVIIKSFIVMKVLTTQTLVLCTLIFIISCNDNDNMYQKCAN
jgi:hypothetical protein